eukprot:TRINITY_DN12678_c0_g1_i1.p1 TRINITY_DN12678_c0_g1~~TRINITY_DN12678_c0_g1_i1.p1  ORF type:complete len:381 (-),score=76.05 TRINITY_DN12678_c0_g1_i1:555-1676(-)
MNSFNKRVQAVFGPLESPTDPITWNLDQNVIFKGPEQDKQEKSNDALMQCDQEDMNSEQDSEAEEEEFQLRKQMFIGTSLDLLSQSNVEDKEVPTREFTNAMDNELEEDAYDIIATQSYGEQQKQPKPKPPLSSTKPPPLIKLSQAEEPPYKKSKLNVMLQQFLKRQTVNKQASAEITEIHDEETEPVQNQQSNKRIRRENVTQSSLQKLYEQKLVNQQNLGEILNNKLIIGGKQIKQIQYQLEKPLIVGGGISQLEAEEAANNSPFLSSQQDVEGSDFETNETFLAKEQSRGSVSNQRIEFVPRESRQDFNQVCEMEIDNVNYVTGKRLPKILEEQEEMEEETQISDVEFGNKHKKDRKHRNYRKVNSKQLD